MTIDGIVEGNLAKLEELNRDELTLDVVRNLAGMSQGALHRRVDNGFDYKNKRSVASLIGKQRPVLEGWPDTSDLGELLPVGPHVFRNWYRNEQTRKSMGAEKILGKIRYSPDWFNPIKEFVEKYGELIVPSEAMDILGISSIRLNNTRKLPSIRPGGKKTQRFYPRKATEKLQKKLEKVSMADLLTSEEVSTELDAEPKDVRMWIPHKLRHPLNNNLLYHRNVLKKYRNAVFVRCTRLSKILKYCEKNIFEDSEIRNKIGYLVFYGKLPSEKIGEDYSSVFLSRESEMEVRNIYTHLKEFSESEISLLRLSNAANQIGLTHKQLELLLVKCGEEYLLTSGEEVRHSLSTIRENRKIFLRPRIPYIRWTENTDRYLSSEVVNSLQKHVTKAKKVATDQGFTPFDGYWYGRLAFSIIGNYRDLK